MTPDFDRVMARWVLGILTGAVALTRVEERQANTAKTLERIWIAVERHGAGQGRRLRSLLDSHWTPG